MRQKIIPKRVLIICLLIAVLAAFSGCKSPAPQRCGIENCHGFDIVCGDKYPVACTMMYMIGDGCRQYAKCEIIGGKCTAVLSEQFQSCKECVEQCLASPDTNHYECENGCLGRE